MSETNTNHPDFIFEKLTTTTANVTLFGIQKEIEFTKELLLVGDQVEIMISILKFNFQHHEAEKYTIDLEITLNESSTEVIEKFMATGTIQFEFTGQWPTQFGEVSAEAVHFTPSIKIDQVTFGPVDLEMTGQIIFDDLINDSIPLAIVNVGDLLELRDEIEVFIIMDAKNYLLPYALIPQRDIITMDRYINEHSELGTFEAGNITNKTSFLPEVVPLSAETLIRRLIERKATTDSKMKVLNWLKWAYFIKKGLITPTFDAPEVAELIFGLKENESKLIIEACKSLSRDPEEVLHYLYLKDYATTQEELQSELLACNYYPTTEEIDDAIEAFFNCDIQTRILRKVSSLSIAMEKQIGLSVGVNRGEADHIASQLSPYEKLMAKMLKASGYSLTVVDAFLKFECEQSTFFRIKILKEAGFPLNEIIDAFTAENIGVTELLIHLLHVGCNLIDIGIVLRYQLGITDENEVRSQLEALDITSLEMAVIFKIVYGTGPTVTSQLFMGNDDVIRILRFVFGLPFAQTFSILQDIGFQTENLEDSVERVYTSEVIIDTEYLTKYNVTFDYNALTGFDKAKHSAIMNMYSTWCFKYSDYREELENWESVYSFTPKRGNVVSIVKNGLQEIAQESLDILKGIRYTASEAQKRALQNNQTNTSFVQFSVEDNVYENTQTQQQYLPYTLHPLEVEDELAGYVVNSRSTDASMVEQLGVKYNVDENVLNVIDQTVLQSLPQILIIKVEKAAIYEGMSYYKNSEGMSIQNALITLKNAGYTSALIGNVMHSIYDITDRSQAVDLLIEAGFFLVDIAIILHKIYKHPVINTIELLSPLGVQFRDMAECLEIIFDVSSNEFNLVATIHYYKQQGLQAQFAGNNLRDRFHCNASYASTVLLQAGYSHKATLKTLKKAFDCDLPELVEVFENNLILTRAPFDLEFNSLDYYNYNNYYPQVYRILKAVGITIFGLENFVKWCQAYMIQIPSSADYFSGGFKELNNLLKEWFENKTIITSEEINRSLLLKFTVDSNPIYAGQSLYITHSDFTNHLKSVGYSSVEIENHLKANVVETSGKSETELAPLLSQEYSPVADTPIQELIDSLKNNHGVTTGKLALDVFCELLPMEQPQVYKKVLAALNDNFPYYTGKTKINCIWAASHNANGLIKILKEGYGDSKETVRYFLRRIGYSESYITGKILHHFEMTHDETLVFLGLDSYKANALFQLPENRASNNPDLVTYAQEINYYGIEESVNYKNLSEYLWVLAGMTSNSEEVKDLITPKHNVLDDLYKLMGELEDVETVQHIASTLYGISKNQKTKLNELIIGYRQKHYPDFVLNGGQSDFLVKARLNYNLGFRKTISTFLNDILGYNIVESAQILLENGFGELLTAQVLFEGCVVSVYAKSNEIEETFTFQTLLSSKSSNYIEDLFSNFGFWGIRNFRYVQIAHALRDQTHTEFSFEYDKKWTSIPRVLRELTSHKSTFTAESVFPVYEAFDIDFYMAHHHMRRYFREISPIHKPSLASMISIVSLYAQDKSATMSLPRYNRIKSTIRGVEDYQKAALEQFFFAYNPPGYTTSYYKLRDQGEYESANKAIKKGKSGVKIYRYWG